MNSATVREMMRDTLIVGLTEANEYAIRFNVERTWFGSPDAITVLWTDFDTFVRSAHSDVASVLLEMKETIANCFEHDRGARAPIEVEVIYSRSMKQTNQTEG